MEWGVPSDLLACPFRTLQLTGVPNPLVGLGLSLVPRDRFRSFPSDNEKRYYVLTKGLRSSSPFFCIVTSVVCFAYLQMA